MFDAQHAEDEETGANGSYDLAHGLLRLALEPEEDDFEEAFTSLSPGDVVGRYTLVEELGRGGFGIVWKAEQVEPIKREVALKIIKPDMNSRAVIARFRRERQALAQMSHPFITMVLDAGSTAQNCPYFAMELVDGVPITNYTKSHAMDVRQCIELIYDVCSAVQHAHQKGVLHRDLKPTNILVTEVNGKPVPKVIDFGIAKALHADSRSQESMAFTVEGMMLGTPHYMAPEHATLGSDQVDVRADVYSLGAILYEMLTGWHPVEVESEATLPPNEVLRKICAGEPMRPSTRISRSGYPDSGVVRDPALLKGELDWLVLKALEKSPDDRYPSVSALAEDLMRYLQDEPLSVGPPSAWYRLRKLASRYRMAFAIGGVTLVAIIVVAIVSIIDLQRESAGRQLAEQLKARAETSEAIARDEASKASKLVIFLGGLLKSAGKYVDTGKNPEALRLALDDSLQELERFNGQPEVQVSLYENLGEVYLSMGDSARALPVLEKQRALCEQLYGENDPRTIRLAVPLAKVAIDVTKDHPKALTLLEDAWRRLDKTAARQTKDGFDVGLMLANELSVGGRQSEALALAQQLSTQHNGVGLPAREDITFMKGLAEIQRRAGDLVGAVETVKEAIDLVPPGSKIPARQSKRASLLQVLGRVESQSGRFEDAVLHLEDSLKLVQKAKGDENVKCIDLLIELARNYALNKQIDEAMDSAQKAFSIAQKTGHEVQQIHALRASGDILEDAGQLDKALPYRRQCAELGSEFASTLMVKFKDEETLATLLSKLGQHGEAVQKALTLASEMKDNPDAFSIEREREAALYNALISIVQRAQATTGSKDYDAQIAEWKAAKQRIQQLVP